MMRGFKYSFLKSLLSVLAFFAVELAAQSVSTRYDGTNKLWIDATSAVDVAFRIEASADLQAWQEISDQASGPFSLWIDPKHDSCRFFRLRHWSTEELPITLMLIGDSTVADFISNSGMYYGWGDAMPGFFKPNVRLVNFALTMQSSETFLTSIQKDNMLLIKPEFVLVQLGMVDIYPGLETTIAEYEANLKVIVQMIRDFEGTPVLVTPTAPMLFENGLIRPIMLERADAVRKVAAELQTYLVDLNRLTTELYNSLGPANSFYIAWPGDPGHFSQAGSEVISELVVEGLPAILRTQSLR